jgi:hypothetical protein
MLDIKLLLQQTLDSAKKLAEEPMPDWYNIHDYSSGFYYGRKSAAQDKIDLIEEILNQLDKRSE